MPDSPTSSSSTSGCRNSLDAGEHLQALRPALKVVYLAQNRDPVRAAEAGVKLSE
jgi:hypothetical protein